MVRYLHRHILPILYAGECVVSDILRPFAMYNVA